MSKTEFLILIPGVLYGIGLADLLKLSFKKYYFEAYLWGLIMLMVLVLHWFDLFENIGSITDHRGKFLLSLVVPLLYTTTCYNLTPDDESKVYFMDNRKKLFLLLASLSLSNTLVQLLYEAPDERLIIKLVIIPFLILAGYWNNLYFRISIAVAVFILYSQYFIKG